MNQPLIDITRADQAVSPVANDAPESKPETAEVLGVPLALADYERTMDWIDATIETSGKATLSAAAVHLVMVAQEDDTTRDAVTDMSLVVPDGQPLVWALKALGHEHATRVYGPDLMAKYCARAAGTDTKMYLYGGRNQGALVELALRLRRRYPGLKIVGGYSPPFRPLTGDERQWVVDDINRSKADVVWVGTGQPKQEIWMREMRPLLDAPMLIGVGAAFDFHAGLVPQAPTWMQNVGLEWVFRLSKEPRRLWRRYARYNPRFVAGFARQYTRARARRPRR
ncbi:MAG TPA: WecB/TagA/CpsF family glycosyltransferase [Solirubrobacteraceae bacterium]|jgi:N-acetylglucosaminyldiphosphoundecaprenol N-acetyl-beta-D-mannosaminyltransferase